MSVDTRARHAVRGLQGSVVLVTPVALPVVTRRHRVSLIAGLAGGLVYWLIAGRSAGLQRIERTDP